MQMSEEVVYMAVLGGIYPVPVTVAIFKSLECAEEFCNLKNMDIPSDNITFGTDHRHSYIINYFYFFTVPCAPK
jgi:hypothetical protein